MGSPQFLNFLVLMSAVVHIGYLACRNCKPELDH